MFRVKGKWNHEDALLRFYNLQRGHLRPQDNTRQGGQMTASKAPDISVILDNGDLFTRSTR